MSLTDFKLRELALSYVSRTDGCKYYHLTKVGCREKKLSVATIQAVDKLKKHTVEEIESCINDKIEQIRIVMEQVKTIYPDLEPAIYPGMAEAIYPGFQSLLADPDDRKDLFEVTSPNIMGNANCIFGMVYFNELHLQDDGNYTVRYFPLSEKIRLCKCEKFYDQPRLPRCSAVAVSEDILLTAGHCVECDADDNCMEEIKEKMKQFAFVRGYGIACDNDMDANYKRILTFKEEDIFRPVEVLHRVNSANQDFMLLRLNKKIEPNKVTNEFDLSVPRKDLAYYMIGHPSRLPMKITTNGRWKGVQDTHTFTTTLDAFRGNSGSPVFNADDHRLSGILLGGEQDYYKNAVLDGYQSCVCFSEKCKGEKVQKIASIKPYIDRYK